MIDRIERDKTNVAVRRQEIDGLGQPPRERILMSQSSFMTNSDRRVGRGEAVIVSGGNALILR